MSRRNDSPIFGLEKLPRLPPVTNNVLPSYESTFGPPSWVASPQVTALEMEADELFLTHSQVTINAIASTAADSGQTLITRKILTDSANTCPAYKRLYDAVSTQDLAQFQHSDLKQFDRVKNELNKLNEINEIKRNETKLNDNELTTLENIVMLQSRIVIPASLRKTVLRHLHSNHPGVQAMLSRATQTVYWPNFRQDIVEIRNNCETCNKYAPSNPPTQPIPDADLPQYPFQVICADFMDWSGHTYLVIVDKYSNWLSVFKLPKDDTCNLIQCLRDYFAVFGVAEVLCSDGATVFTSQEMDSFCRTWGIKQRISSAYHPTGNKRAEVGVKSAKRLIRDNVGQSGTLKTNQFTQALLNHRNTPDPLSKVSPAQIVFGREIRDIIPRISYKPRSQWSDLAASRETAFLQRHYAKSELPRPQKSLSELSIGDKVYIQDQNGASPRRWSKSGVIVQSLPFQSYLVLIDGSRKLTKRNRQYLRRFVPFSQSFSNPSDPYIRPPTTDAPPTAAFHPEDIPLAVAVASLDLNFQEVPTIPLASQKSLVEGIEDT